MFTVAIASENGEYDGEIYRALLERILDKEVERWKTVRRFDGRKAVGKYAGIFLHEASQAGIKHALIAIDNDGTAKKRPEHGLHCAPSPPVDCSEDGCSVCWLTTKIPASWAESGNKHCIVVPVQLLETWLLFLRGDPPLKPTPEQCFSYNRNDVKKKFFGKPIPPTESRLQLALEQVGSPDAIQRLRERASFQHFERQVAAWP